MAEHADAAVVGNYLSEGQAERARDHLREHGIERVTVAHPAEDTWQVEVPADERRAALAELQRVQKWIMETHP